MKPTKIFFICFVALWAFSAPITAWASPQDPGCLTMSFVNTPVKRVLNEIEKQSGYSFVYANNLININERIDFKTDKQPVSEVLDLLAKTLNISYSVKDKQVVLSPPSKQNSPAQPDEILVTGCVKESGSGTPLPYVTVVIKGTSEMATTDAKGQYSIKAPSDATLAFSFLGYNPLDIPIAGRMVVDVELEPADTALDEIMVVAYGTAKKGSYTGSAAVVNQKTFSNRPLTEVSRALTGTTAGLQIGTSNGQPGSAPTIRIRGLGSFNASNSPLLVLDGMPYDNAMSSINPNDIESVTVLKDASSAALYGARAANGVIMITTRKGKQGKQQISAKYNIGLTTRQSKDYKTVGMDDYFQLYWESNRNNALLEGKTLAEANATAGATTMAGITYNPYNMEADLLFDPQTGKINPNAQLLWADDLDWVGAISQVGIRHDANLSISGANAKSDYYASAGYMKENGYIIGSLLNRYSAKTNVNSQLTKWLKTGINLTAAITQSEGNQNESGGNLSNPFRFTRFLGNPYPIHVHNPETGEYLYDEKGEKIYDFGTGYSIGDIVVPKRDIFSGTNPAIMLKHRYDGYRRSTINAKVYAEVSFLKNFKLTVTGGVGTNLYKSWYGNYVMAELSNSGTSTKSVSTTTTWTFNEVLNYAKTIGKHNIDAMVGHESYDFEYNYLTAGMSGQVIKGDNFEFKNYTTPSFIPNSYTRNYKVEGYLSRLNYDYDGKYFASVSFRRDGSSRFHKDVRWGNFWSVGAGWRIDRENFTKTISFVNLLKFRASYGIVGNDDLTSYYPWQAAYSPSQYASYAGFLQATLENKALSWENSANLDIALEFGLFRSRLNGTIEFFNRVSGNLLFSVPQPPSSGVSSVTVNAGTMYNRGMELSLDYTLLRQRNWKWSVSANATFLQNKITKLPIDPYKTSVYKIQEGHSRYDFWLRQWYKVNPDNGYNLFVADVENEDYEFAEGELITIDGVAYTEVINHAKYDFSGTAMPKVTGGFGSSLSWKNWAFSFNFYYQLGGKYYDSTYASLMQTSGNLANWQRLHVDLLRRWQQAGDITDVAKVTMGTDNTNIQAATSTRWLTHSNMLELTHISLSYTLPDAIAKKLTLDELKFYFSADNPFLFAPRRGMFPRRNFHSGYDGNATVYLPSRTFSFGLSVNF